MTNCYGCGKKISKRLEGAYVRESWGIKINFCSDECYKGWMNV